MRAHILRAHALAIRIAVEHERLLPQTRRKGLLAAEIAREADSVPRVVEGIRGLAAIAKRDGLHVSVKRGEGLNGIGSV